MRIFYRKEIQSSPATAPLWIPKLQSWLLGILDICTKTIRFAKSKIANWLETFMFNGEVDANAKSITIVDWLGTFDNHLTHAHPISYNEALAKGLKVSLLEINKKFQEKTLLVISIVTIEITNNVKIIENQNGVGVFIQVSR